jgi:hypothetical protein
MTSMWWWQPSSPVLVRSSPTTCAAFPQDRLPIGISALPPAEFAASAVSLDPVRARAAVAAIAARSGRKGPPLTEDEVLDTLADRYGMIRTAEILRPVR